MYVHVSMGTKSKFMTSHAWLYSVHMEVSFGTIMPTHLTLITKFTVPDYTVLIFSSPMENRRNGLSRCESLNTAKMLVLYFKANSNLSCEMPIQKKLIISISVRLNLRQNEK